MHENNVDLKKSSAMVDLALSPSGRLYWENTESIAAETAGTPVDEKLQALLVVSPLRGLLELGLTMIQTPLPPGLRFWRRFSHDFIHVVCQSARAANDQSEAWRTLPPPLEELKSLVEQAPFVRGAEYLNLERLGALWLELRQELIQAVAGFKTPTLEAFLAAHQLSWNKVGRVCFHLAENKNDPDHPFAFLATYTVRLSQNATLQHWPLSRALQEYAGESKRAQLLNLLLPIQKAAETSEWIQKLLDSQALFHPLAWGGAEAFQFLQATSVMEAAGIIVRIPNWWDPKKPPHPQIQIKIGDKNPKNALGFDALLDFNADLVLPDGQRLSESELKNLLNGTGQSLVQVKGQWVAVDPEKLNAVLAHWRTLERQTGKQGLSWAEGLRWLAGAGQAAESLTPDQTAMEYSRVIEGDWLRETLARLRQPGENGGPWDEILQIHLRAHLRPYQRAGVHWLWRLYQLRLGGCLADDMGLGKTLQMIALWLLIKRHRHSELPAQKKPHLLIVPASLLGNWQNEIRRFAPDLKVWITHASAPRQPDPSREKSEEKAWQKKPDEEQTDVVITTYGTVSRLPWMSAAAWDTVVLDEAQSIKNPSAKQTQAIKALSAQVRFILTGTPIENRLADLWSLFDFAAPGLLGSSRAFTDYARSPDFNGQVRRLVAPYLLRRLKTDKTVIADLPDKTEMDTYCALSRVQIAAYQQTVNDLTRQLKLNREIDDMARRGLVLSTLLKLKQVCNHPSQWLGHGEYAVMDSGKFQRLQELAAVIAAKQEKALIFTQFREIMPALHDCLASIFQRPGLMLHGQTPVKQRAELVHAFQQESGPPFFVLSLKAGGTGLNLTAAAHVIHFDRWWNPAVENQATDRAYRLGQKNNVLVHRFICPGTIEEKIDALIRSKKALAEDILSTGGELNLTELNDQELIRMVTLDIHQVIGES